MSIQRFGNLGDDQYIIESGSGDLVKYEDHLAAMEAQEERMMRFADYYAQYCWDYARENVSPNMDMKQVFQYFLDNVEKKKK